MARKSTYDRGDVIAAALTVLERDGARAVTARHVGREMGASTAPVYRNFASMDDLLGELTCRARDILLDYLLRDWTEERFLNMGVGYLRFAQERPNLFRALYLEPLTNACPDAEFNGPLLAVLDEHPLLGALERSLKEELLFQAGVYSHGLAVFIVAGLWEDPDLELATRWLRSVGGLLIRAALESGGLAVPADLERHFGTFTVPWRCPGGQEAGERDDG